jgi:hypothetical protein
MRNPGPHFHTRSVGGRLRPPTFSICILHMEGALLDLQNGAPCWLVIGHRPQIHFTPKGNSLRVVLAPFPYSVGGRLDLELLYLLLADFWSASFSFDLVYLVFCFLYILKNQRFQNENL